MTGSVVGGWLLGQLWKEWQPLTGWLTLAALLPSIWFLIVRVLDWQSSGIGYTNGDFTLRYSKRFYLHTVVIPGASVVGVTFRRVCSRHSVGTATCYWTPIPRDGGGTGTEPASGGGKGSVPAGGDLFITNRNIRAK